MLLLAFMVLGRVTGAIGEQMGVDVPLLVFELLHLTSGRSAPNNTNWTLFWRHCHAAPESDYKNLFRWLEMIDNSTEGSAVRAEVPLIPYTQLLLQAHFRKLFTLSGADEDSLAPLLCSQVTSIFIDSLCVGLAIVAALGLLHFVYTRVSGLISEFQHAARRAGVRNNNNPLDVIFQVLASDTRLVMLAFSIYSQVSSLAHGPGGANLRLGIAVGMLVAFWSAYEVWGTRVARVARNIGEQIIEYVED